MRNITGSATATAGLNSLQKPSTYNTSTKAVRPSIMLCSRRSSAGSVRSCSSFRTKNEPNTTHDRLKSRA
jgi:hypothetical protein